MTRKILTVIFIVLALAAISLGVGYVVQAQEIHALQKQVAKQQTNGKIVNFLNLFIQKVLEANSDISFDDRLQLENEVRSLNDQQILGQWDKFVNSKTVEDAQLQVKNLLQLLVSKIYS